MVGVGMIYQEWSFIYNLVRIECTSTNASEKVIINMLKCKMT
jgi:hypothetical protein